MEPRVDGQRPLACSSSVAVISCSNTHNRGRYTPTGKNDQAVPIIAITPG
jgi:hypothetical protein